ncbi:sodium-independent sulfate anion transporter-like [Oscarella lobularis]|uniref:sodium-independent sulfate anion transporter-like n=1 Tax=Oscarella lobularis TaxID=121494 RepID=UPI0033136512
MGLILDCIAFFEANRNKRKALFVDYCRDRFPIVKWLPKYNTKTLISDIIAGLTVGLMVVPQSLAYAKIAGFEDPKYGLYASFMGCFVYAIFGTSKDITLGPTAIMSQIVVAARGDNGVGYVFVMTLTCGIIQFALGFLKLGMIVNLISLPVVSGFTSAAAITIATGQIKHLLGIQPPSGKKIPRNFLPCIEKSIEYIKHSHVWDIVMGFSCILLVLFLRFLKSHVQKWDKDNNHSKPPPSHKQLVARKFLWAITTGRNAVVVLVAGLIAYAVCSVEWNCWNKMELVRNIDGGLPSVIVPNITLTTLEDLDAALAVIPLMGFLEAISIAQAFARENGYRVDASQELIAIGISNVVASFIQSYPVTGSFSRTSVNAQSGVRTPLGGVFTGLVVLLALAFLTPLFRYIPEAALAAIIITAVVHMVNVRILKQIFRLGPFELLPWAASFLGTLFLGIQYGILVAAGIHLLFPLYRLMTPRHSCTYRDDMAVAKLNEGLYYTGIDQLRDIIHEVIDKPDPDGNFGVRLRVIILDASHMPSMDFTVVQGIEEIVNELKKKDIRLVIAGLQDPIEALLRKADINDLVLMPSVQVALSGKESASLSPERERIQ